MKNNDVVILAAKRSPVGRFQRSLKDLTAPQLAGLVIKAILAEVSPRILGLTFHDKRRVIMGNVLSAGVGQNPARQAAIAGDLSMAWSAHTVNRVCTSSLMSLWSAYQFARENEDIVIAGGMESMSLSPYLFRRPDGIGFGHINKDNHAQRAKLLSILGREQGMAVPNTYPIDLIDSMLWDGLCDVYCQGNPHMGELADKLARGEIVDEVLSSPRQVFLREEQDDYAFLSYERAWNAKKLGNEVLGIAAHGYPIAYDEGVREPDREKMRALSPVFGKTITAANASQLSDGAAALLVATRRQARLLGCMNPLARIVGFSDYAYKSELYTTAPIFAARAVLRRARMDIEDIDLFEVGEPFAVAPLYFMHELHVPIEKLNIWGNMIPRGHPLGATGAMLIINLIYALKHVRGRYGLAVTCNGGGEAVAVIIENL